jgi:multidrug efflux pump subunit AcrB
VFFTATGMIGMIALAGIAVRNSIILIDFVQNAEQHGQPLRTRSCRAARCGCGRSC